MAVLVGGLDSAVLLAELSRRARRIVPLYIRFGLAWEEAEHASMLRFLDAVRLPVVAPLQVLELPITDLYGPHWSVTKRSVPDARSDDRSVELVGRNLLLLSKSMVFAALNSLGAIGLAITEANPFSDATPFFLNQLATLSRAAVGRPVRVLTPFRRLHKSDVIARGSGLPLHLTCSCIAPEGEIHCGACNKCAERQRGFWEAGVIDKTRYSRPLDPSEFRRSALG